MAKRKRRGYFEEILVISGLDGLSNASVRKLTEVLNHAALRLLTVAHNQISEAHYMASLGRKKVASELLRNAIETAEVAAPIMPEASGQAIALAKTLKKSL